MKFLTPKRRIAALTLAVLLLVSISAAASTPGRSAGTEETVSVVSFSKNGKIAKDISFSPDDFLVIGDDTAVLDSIIVTSLPAREAGILMMGDELLAVGDVISVSAMEGMHFSSLASPALLSTSFQFAPVFSTGNSGQQCKVNLYLLSDENNAPIAENFEFTTYKNVAYTGLFSAVDPEGDVITFQLIDKPARGSIELCEEGSAEFVYTPYENKTGKDSFTYVAIDSVGNISEKATVKIRIEKPSTKVTYADMTGHPAYNAAIRLAEEDIYIGANMDGKYYFQPNIPMSRVEFLAMAMAALDSEVLNGITVTGFYDDSAIETWAKPYVASALKSGSVQGSFSDNGEIVFRGKDTITMTEAAVLLNRMLSVSDVKAEVWGGNVEQIPTWACQAVMNLETVGVIHPNSDGSIILSDSVTRADAAIMLASALSVLENREVSDGWMYW